MKIQYIVSSTGDISDLSSCSVISPFCIALYAEVYVSDFRESPNSKFTVACENNAAHAKKSVEANYIPIYSWKRVGSV